MKNIYVIIYAKYFKDKLWNVENLKAFKTREEAQEEIKRIAAQNGVKPITNYWQETMCKVQKGSIKEMFYYQSIELQ